MPKRWITLALMAAIATSLSAFSIETRAPAMAATSSAGRGSKDLRRKLLRVSRRRWSRPAWRISPACGQSNGDGFAR